MKARSVVFTHIQHPTTIFGFPPLLVGITAVVAVVVFLVTIILGAVAISMIAFGVMLAMGLVISHRVARTDRHVVSVFLTSARFWLLSPRRWLLAGAAPDPRSLEDRS